MSSKINTIDVPHLGGISAGYQLSQPFSPSNPTVVLLHPFIMTGEIYSPWFSKSELKSKPNFLAVDLLGHGKTRAHKVEHWNCWDSATMTLQVMYALKIQKAYVLGMSQGGFIGVRMALLQPERVRQTL